MITMIKHLLDDYTDNIKLGKRRMMNRNVVLIQWKNVIVSYLRICKAPLAEIAIQRRSQHGSLEERISSNNKRKREAAQFRSRLRSSNSSDVFVPRTKTKMGDRAFEVAGPRTWNSLPATIRETKTLPAFKK